MNKKNFLIFVAMLATVSIGWFTFLSGMTGSTSEYQSSLELAQVSMDKGLYEQAIEYYKAAIGYENSEELYLKIRDAYELVYAEEPIAFIRNMYIEDMAEAARKYPENEVFWLIQAKLHMDAGNQNQAFYTLRDAVARGAGGEELMTLYTSLMNTVKTDYKKYQDFHMALNGYISVYNGKSWYLLDESGKTLLDDYQMIGLVNDEGMGLYISQIDTRILDANGVPRARFDFTPEDAGYYNQRVDLLPVFLDGAWRYVNSDGEFFSNSYEIAGSFYGNEAVAMRSGKWMRVYADGTEEVLDRIEDIKLDLYGCHIQNDVIIACEKGRYHLYDTEFNRIGDFSADDMDICISTDGIAYCVGGKWGFVTADGTVVREPQYAGAKSFANGYAAVCDENGLWGFVDTQFSEVIGNAYTQAYYFTKAGTCMVSTEEGSVQLLSFVFQ